MGEWLSTYKKTIVSTLIVIATLIVGFALVYGYINGSIGKFVDNFTAIISPIIIGFIIAYLSNPIVKFIEKYILKWIPKFSIRRLLSIIITFAIIIGFIFFIVTMLLPNILTTLQSFWDAYIVNYETSLKGLAIRINTIMDRFSFLDTVQRLNPEGLVDWVRENFPWIDKIIEGDISGIIPIDPNSQPSTDESSGGHSTGINFSEMFTMEKITEVLKYAFSFGTSLFTIIKDTILGIFIAIYMLMSKERCKAYIKRLLNSIFSPKKVRAILRFGSLLDRSFGGFIEGQLLDAIVVGICSYFIFIIFELPIPHLLATIIAVTNVIPIFGPFIGGIPAALLVLLTEPEKTLLFIILIVIIQQIDGNLICPHILGDKINISSLATIIAIITMGGLFGIFGMLIGVPVFAVIIHMIDDYTMNSLREKSLATSITDYHVGNADAVVDKSQKTKTVSFKKIKVLFALLIKRLKKVLKKQNKKEK